LSFSERLPLSSVTDLAPVKARNLLSSAKYLSEQDRMMLGGEAGFDRMIRIEEQ
jgi:hypothetical protein